MRAVRKTLGVSTEMFARMAGLGTANLASIENERNRWKTCHLKTLKPALEAHLARCAVAVAGVSTVFHDVKPSAFIHAGFAQGPTSSVFGDIRPNQTEK